MSMIINATFAENKNDFGYIINHSILSGFLFLGGNTAQKKQTHIWLLLIYMVIGAVGLYGNVELWSYTFIF